MSGIPAASGAIAAARKFSDQVIVGVAYRDGSGHAKELVIQTVRKKDTEGILIALVDLNKNTTRIFRTGRW